MRGGENGLFGFMQRIGLTATAGHTEKPAEKHMLLGGFCCFCARVYREAANPRARPQASARSTEGLEPSASIPSAAMQL